MPVSVQEARTVRLVILGAARVGKTALIRRFLHDHFEPRHTCTVEELHLLECGTESGARVRLQILDTSGSYSFPAMRALSIRGGDAFALVYSADEPDTLTEVRRLRQEILEVRGERFTPLTVVANKADLKESAHGVTSLVEEDLKESAHGVTSLVEEEWSAGFVEASARTGENVLAVFRDLLSRADVPSPALQRRGDTVRKDSARRKKPPFKKSNSCSIS